MNFPVPLLLRFFMRACAKIPKMSLGRENLYTTRLTLELVLDPRLTPKLVLDGRRTMDNKQQGDAATPTAPPTSNAYQVPAAPKSCATRPEGYRQPTTGPVRRLETVAKTAWHHSSYHCVRLVLVTINSSMQYATTQRQGPPAYIIGTDT